MALSDPETTHLPGATHRLVTNPTKAVALRVAFFIAVDVSVTGITTGGFPYSSCLPLFCLPFPPRLPRPRAPRGEMCFPPGFPSLQYQQQEHGQHSFIQPPCFANIGDDHTAYGLSAGPGLNLIDAQCCMCVSPPRTQIRHNG